MTTVVVDGGYLEQADVGLGVFTRRLLDALLKRTHELPFGIAVAVPADLAADKPFRFLGRACLPVPRLRAPHPLLAQMFWQIALGRHTRRLQPPVRLLCTGPFWAPSAAAHVGVCHDFIHRHFPQYHGRRGLRRWLYGRMEQFLARADTIVAVSEHTAGDLRRHLVVPAARLRVIREWLPTAYTPERAAAGREEVLARCGLPPGAFLYVGGYDCRKNVELLIRAYALARSRAACPPLVLAGRLPPPHSRLHCAVEETLRDVGLSGSPAVHTPGRIDAEHMPGLYGAATLLAYPSLYEGFGLPPMEAMGCGCPAVCADTSSLPEVVTDSAYRFGGRDVEGLAALLVRSARGDLPLNPGFRREAFDETAALRAWTEVLETAV